MSKSKEGEPLSIFDVIGLEKDEGDRICMEFAKSKRESSNMLELAKSMGIKDAGMLCDNCRVMILKGFYYGRMVEENDSELKEKMAKLSKILSVTISFLVKEGYTDEAKVFLKRIGDELGRDEEITKTGLKILFDAIDKEKRKREG